MLYSVLQGTHVSFFVLPAQIAQSVVCLGLGSGVCRFVPFTSCQLLVTG